MAKCVICLTPARVEMDRFIREHPGMKQREMADYFNETFAAPVYQGAEIVYTQQHVGAHLHHMLPDSYIDLMTLLQESAGDLFASLAQAAKNAEEPVDRMLYLVLMEQVLYLGRNGPDLKAALSAVSVLKNKKVDPIDALRELLRSSKGTTEVYVVEGPEQATGDGPRPVDGDGGTRLQLPPIPGRPEAPGADVVGAGSVHRERPEAGEPAVPGELVGED